MPPIHDVGLGNSEGKPYYGRIAIFLGIVLVIYLVYRAKANASAGSSGQSGSTQSSGSATDNYLRLLGDIQGVSSSTGNLLQQYQGVFQTDFQQLQTQLNAQSNALTNTGNANSTAIANALNATNGALKELYQNIDSEFRTISGVYGQQASDQFQSLYALLTTVLQIAEPTDTAACTDSKGIVNIPCLQARIAAHPNLPALAAPGRR